jgi:cytochrome c oxidase subunit 2
LAKRQRPGGARALPRALGIAAAALPLAGCGSKTDMLSPHGPGAKAIASLWWWLLGGCCFGLLFVTAMLVLAWLRRRSMGPGREPGERAGWIVVLTLGVGVMVTGLVVLFAFGDIALIRHTEAPATAATSLTVRAVGHQWYWEFDYPGHGAVTAGEMHIPVRTPVTVDVRTGDVIHSFWVPELNRKIDAIPGVKNAIELYADKAGVYRGECLQYCGLQHAHMGFLVFADPPATFNAWLAAQARSVRPAASAGERIFMQGSCSSCHAIRGTSAQGRVGPDLTHIGSRTTLAGASIENTPSELGRWIVDSQAIKPGNQMPDIRLDARSLRELVAYLESLR